MDNESLMKKLLVEKKDLGNVIKKQKETIQRLEAYKRTLIKSLGNSEPSMELPIKFEQNHDFKVCKIESGLFLLGIGKSGIKSHDGLPESFRVLRYFRKCRNNLRQDENTWYTTTVLSKNGLKYFIIKDDENNTWKGHDAFYSFMSSFDFKLPFSSIDEWIGLDNPKMTNLLKIQ